MTTTEEQVTQLVNGLAHELANLPTEQAKSVNKFKAANTTTVDTRVPAEVTAVRDNLLSYAEAFAQFMEVAGQKAIDDAKANLDSAEQFAELCQKRADEVRAEAELQAKKSTDYMKKLNDLAILVDAKLG